MEAPKFEGGVEVNCGTRRGSHCPDQNWQHAVSEYESEVLHFSHLDR